MTTQVGVPFKCAKISAVAVYICSSDIITIYNLFFQQDPDARIFVLSMYSHHVRALLCEVWNEFYTMFYMRHNNKVLVHENQLKRHVV